MKKSYTEIYRNKDNQTLVKIIEDKHNYNTKCVSVVQAILKSRNISKEEYHQIALEFMQERVEEMMKHFTPYDSKLQLPHSEILSKETILKMLKDEFIKWMERRDDMDFDVWHYAIGAIL